MTQPQTRYADAGSGKVGYQVFGEGPPDVLFITSWLTNIDVMWEEPSARRYLERLASFSRVINFDKRGCGVSDPVPLTALPSLEQWMDDARVVMDAAESEQAALLGDTEGGQMAVVFAATYPERTSALVLVNSVPRVLRAEHYPIGMPPETAAKLARLYEEQHGVTGALLELTAPSVADDPHFRSWWIKYQRAAMPPRSLAAGYEWERQVDVTSVLPSIRVPTLVIHRTGARYHRIDAGRYLAEHIAGAKLVELPGEDTLPFHAGDFDPVLDEVQEFLTGVRHGPAPNRVLATVMLTDIVASTERAAQLGDQKWLDLLAQHDVVVREHLDRYRGREVDRRGDGFLATFDGPARAVMCAADISRSVEDMGLEIRVGLHAGEIELRDGEVGGIAVHIAARVMDAGDGGVLVSGTVKDLVVGSGIEFSSRGIHSLKGVPGEWPLYEVSEVP